MELRQYPSKFTKFPETFLETIENMLGKVDQCIEVTDTEEKEKKRISAAINKNKEKKKRLL